MKLRFLLTFLTIAGLETCFAHIPDTYFFKAVITTKDTVFNGYFVTEYEYLDDATLAKFKSNDKYFTDRIVTDTREALKTYSFVYQYKVNNASEGPPSLVICVPKSKYAIHKAKIKSIHYLDVVAFKFTGMAIFSDIKKEDLPWVKTQSEKVLQDTSDGCCTIHFRFHEENAEANKIVKEILSLKGENRWAKKEQLQKRLNNFKVIVMYEHLCG